MSLDIILENVLRGNYNSKMLKSILKEEKIDSKEYNEALISLFSSNFTGNISNLISETIPIDEKFSKIDNLEQLNVILEEYYKIENCPSFLYHQAMLEKEDYSVILQIYKQIFGLKPNDNTDMEAWLKNNFEEYAKRIIEKHGNCKTEKDFLDAIQFS